MAVSITWAPFVGVLKTRALYWDLRFVGKLHVYRVISSTSFRQCRDGLVLAWHIPEAMKRLAGGFGGVLVLRSRACVESKPETI